MPAPILKNEGLFWSMTKPTPNGCLEWQGRLDRAGYGLVGRGDKRAHRVAYAFAKGDPSGMFVCHSCDNPRCINPDHLWLGTPGDNMRDARDKKRFPKMLLTHCKRGHPFDDKNTYRRNGHRSCRACNAAAVARYQQNRRAKA